MDDHDNEIKQYLQDNGYYADQTYPLWQITQAALNSKLRNTLELMAKSHPSIEWLIWCIDQKVPHFVGIYADTIVEFCNLVSIFTLTDLLEFSIEKCDVGGLTEWLDPELKVETFREVNSSWINSAIHNSDWVLATNYSIRYRDIIYKTIDITGLNTLLKSDNVDLLSYLSQARDCDDFADMALYKQKRKGYGNITRGYCEYTSYNKDGDFLFNHAVNIAVLDFGDVVLTEPQTDKIYYPGDIIINSGEVTSQKIYEIRF